MGIGVVADQIDLQIVVDVPEVTHSRADIRSIAVGAGVHIVHQVLIVIRVKGDAQR